jgi:hypothetical protein
MCCSTRPPGNGASPGRFHNFCIAWIPSRRIHSEKFSRRPTRQRRRYFTPPTRRGCGWSAPSRKQSAYQRKRSPAFAVSTRREGASTNGNGAHGRQGDSPSEQAGRAPSQVAGETLPSEWTRTRRSTVIGAAKHRHQRPRSLAQPRLVVLVFQKEERKA